MIAATAPLPSRGACVMTPAPTPIPSHVSIHARRHLLSWRARGALAQAQRWVCRRTAAHTHIHIRTNTHTHTCARTQDTLQALRKRAPF